MIRGTAVVAAALALAACGGGHDTDHAPVAHTLAPTGQELVVTSRMVVARVEAAGSAEPFAEATLSTKLMGTVLEVLPREGDLVRAGAVLVRIDARDLAAKQAQVAAGLSEAEAMQAEAEAHARRIRGLFDDEAATQAQLDAVETGLARAQAAVASTRAAAAELDAVRDYSVVRAPFDAMVTARFVDPGAFAAPGAPLLTVQDASQLRIAASAAPDALREIARGDTIDAMVEGVATKAVVEGIVPVAGTAVHRVNAIVDNTDRRFLAGSAAGLLLPQGDRPALLVPEAAIQRQGDLTGVWLRTGETTDLRWVRLGTIRDGMIEVLSGLRDGDTIIVPTKVAAAGAH